MRPGTTSVYRRVSASKRAEENPSTGQVSILNHDKRGDKGRADVTAYLGVDRLIVINSAPEPITLTNVTTDIEDLLVPLFDQETGGLALQPHETQEILINKDLSQGPHLTVDFDIEYTDDSGPTKRKLPLKL